MFLAWCYCFFVNYRFYSETHSEFLSPKNYSQDYEISTGKVMHVFDETPHRQCETKIVSIFSFWSWGQMQVNGEAYLQTGTAWLIRYLRNNITLCPTIEKKINSKTFFKNIFETVPVVILYANNQRCRLTCTSKVQVISKRVAGHLVCFLDNNFEWRRHYSKTTW